MIQGTVRYVHVERSDLTAEHDGSPNIVGYSLNPAAFPGKEWLDVAVQVLAEPSAERCALHTLVPADPICLNYLGWYESEREDTYGREYETTEWRDFVLVEQRVGDATRVIAVCDECGPADLYWVAQGVPT